MRHANAGEEKNEKHKKLIKQYNNNIYIYINITFSGKSYHEEYLPPKSPN